MDVPTVADFLASKDVIYDNDHDQRSATVVRVGKYVMKYNNRTRIEEADNLKYLAANTDLPVPKCYGAGVLPGITNQTYIIMDYVEGDVLEKLWPTLSLEDKAEITRQLRDQVATYRKLPPPDYLGSVNGERLAYRFFRVVDGDPAHGGPFRDATHFKDVLALRILHGFRKTMIENLAKILRMQMDEALGDFRTVFTHADLQAKNVIVKREGVNEDGSGIFTVTIIDWELAGWYPEWWEWCQSPMWSVPKTDPTAWEWEVPKIVPVYAKEFWCWRQAWLWVDGW
jgi:hypothetical protein